MATEHEKTDDLGYSELIWAIRSAALGPEVCLHQDLRGALVCLTELMSYSPAHSFGHGGVKKRSHRSPK